MMETICGICLKEVKEEPSLHSFLTIPTKTDLTIVENPVACNKCIHDTNFSAFVKEEHNLEETKHEFADVIIKNEEIVKEECMLFNSDVLVGVDESVPSDILFYCDQCTFSTNNKQNITDHIFTDCFRYNHFLLDEHRNVHSSEDDENRITSENHNKRCDNKTQSQDKLFKCEFCDYCSTRLGNMKRHALTHTQEKPFKCNFCDYSSNGSGNLKKHLYKHSNEWPFRCDKCDYKSYDKNALSRHSRTHTQEKPFKCDFCDYSSNGSGNLKKHLCKHSDEWPFKCDKCRYKAYDKNAFTRHIRTHTQEKPFKCNLCDYCSNESRSLKKHSFKHSNDFKRRKTTK